MAVLTSTLTTQTFTGQVGNWSSSVFSAGAYTELILDAQFTSLTANATIALSRIDPLGNVVQVWSAARTSNTTDLLTIDIGQCTGYQVSHAFGDQIRIDITTSGTYSGSLSLQGKGGPRYQAGTVLSQSSTAVTTNNTSSALVVGTYTELAVDVNITAKSGTSPTVQFFVDRIGADGISYNIWSSTVISTVTQVSASIGSGFATNQSCGSTIQFRWVLGGTTPSFTFSFSIIGK